MASMESAADRTFRLRWERWSPDIRSGLAAVHHDRVDEVLARVETILRSAAAARPDDLRELDEARLLRPDWLQDPSMMGYVAYTDRYAGTLTGVGERLDHLTSLGVSYLHLMPLLRPREGANDGGYAVADHRSVRPDLGTMDDLSALAAQLRERGMSLVLDLVVNHVAAEHEWAERAIAGDQKYRDYFITYPDRTEPDAWERTLPEVFPDFAPGNFTWNERMGRWVWTTFNAYQWDLNWANPDVFCEFLDIICTLANRGVEVFRLDAIAFIWKRLGTTCQNQPEVHQLTQALRQAVRIAAPAVAFKAEAIVSPDDLIAYLGAGEHHGLVSDMAYHNSLMVQLWSSLAARDTRLTEVALDRFAAKPTTTTWGTYVRCHDDIGWAITDADAAAAGLDGFAHRAFLSDFYAGLAPGSFARGLVFQHNPATGDRRISGSCASLAGLETALTSEDEGRITDAVARHLMLHAVVMGFGGVPLLYMGDELGMLNDADWATEAGHEDDNRWVHRPRMDWDLLAAAEADHASPHGRILVGMRHLIGVRRRTPHLHASVESRVVPSPDPRLLVLRRDHPVGAMLQVYNFSEQTVWVDAQPFADALGPAAGDLISGHRWNLATDRVSIQPYQPLWWVADR
ncbi:alpha-amylase family protein [Aestuariimicrobium sp. T2.26MG-19.2B]|uniref:alpha-amylase family protein n=1 Tax=Aestuariimicrobium sp. T2.26MG-19.2B TaxID=3040679 RepID=UPI002541FD0C|nr:alpha-amylase family protein [Aestuariimicrobium sp. T2.26MG-19.2B]